MSNFYSSPCLVVGPTTDKERNMSNSWTAQALLKVLIFVITCCGLIQIIYISLLFLRHPVRHNTQDATYYSNADRLNAQRLVHERPRDQQRLTTTFYQHPVEADCNTITQLFYRNITQQLENVISDLSNTQRENPQLGDAISLNIKQLEIIKGKIEKHTNSTKSHAEANHFQPHERHKPVQTSTKSKIPAPNHISCKYVCPEAFNHSDLSAGYPFFYKGFDEINCTDRPPLGSIITILFNWASSPEPSPNEANQILSSIDKLYPGVKVVTGLQEHSPLCEAVRCNKIETIFFSRDEARDEIVAWTKLNEKAKTEFVLIAREVNRLTWHSRITRLIRAAGDLEADVVAAAARRPSGEWSYGCYQSQLRNYTLKYTSGYTRSEQECIYCDHITGPFVTRREYFKQIGDSTGFAEWFLRIKSKEAKVVSCPDSMLFLGENNTALRERDRNYWLPAVARKQIEKIILPGNITHYFSATEANTRCKMNKGMGLSHFCMERLSFAIKTFMRLCKEAGCLCELQEGTLLGAVKFNGVLPWERDGDLTFHSNNFSAIENLKSKLTDNGLTLNGHEGTWCCVDEKVAGGVFNLQDTQSSWNIELYGQHLMDSEKLLLDGIQPTTIAFDGELVATPTSPGLFARNRYGAGIYKHAQHWMSSGSSSGWAKYTIGRFTACSNANHHACLDQFETDGNLQFKEP